MKKDDNPDYSRLTAIAKHCGLVPYVENDKVIAGMYTLEGLNAPVDLSACAEDEKSILRTAVRQLSEQADDSYHRGIERDLSED